MIIRGRFMTESPIKKALICGITGQDGSYLTELLICQGLSSARGHPADLHV